MSKNFVEKNHNMFVLKLTIRSATSPIVFILGFFLQFYLRDILFFTAENSLAIFLKAIGFLFATNLIPGVLILFIVYFTYFKLLTRHSYKAMVEGVRLPADESLVITNRLNRIKFTMILVNGTIVFASYITSLLVRGRLASMFEAQSISYLIWIILSSAFAGYYASMLVDHLLIDLRSSLNITTMYKVKVRSLALRYIIVTVGFAFLLYFSVDNSNIVILDAYEIELRQIVLVAEGKISMAEATLNYQQTIANNSRISSSRITLEANEVALPYVSNSVDGDRHRIQFLLTILAMLWIFFLAFMVEFRRTGALKDQIISVSNVIRSLIKGEASLKSRISVLNFDDFGYMTGYVNLLLQFFEEMVKDVKEVAGGIISSSERIELVASQTNSAMQELITSVFSVQESAGVQNKEVDNSTLYLSDLSEATASINSSLRSQIALTNQTSSTANKFAQSVNEVRSMTIRAQGLSTELVEIANDGAKAVEAAITAINLISEASTNMSDAMGAITKIASQTNLLSMNAAIEAAHAGAAGKGFAVVANEVRSLSEDSTRQSRLIRTEINEMKNKIERGLRVSSDAQKALQKILGGIGNTNRIVVAIASAMDGQSDGVNNIVSSISHLTDAGVAVGEQTVSQQQQSDAMQKAMAELKDISKTILHDTGEQATQGKSVSELMKGIVEDTLSNRESIHKLSLAVSKFNLD